jgi:NAD-dependent dihydropyrimidine dehydrogenase PreA subunit
MAHVITGKCIGEVYAACQMTCPANCMHFVAQLPQGYPSAGHGMMVIDPDECIDCGNCKSECPVDAVISNGDEDEFFSEINKNLTRAPAYKGQVANTRPRNDPPRRPENQLR